ncbi:ketopantoate reductase family protein [Gryllotalpicola ginsengisoli]|uniref:ketopantoate reductase family protein n=1 Tax=Gryllotalpicola ginsengisoli TaxID=444608 RepID=UPI0003B446E7|nr:2-dehydropantoate 2-reductase N-terminal domain-containing protein [Gryllotalpicola ginsengisoli]
MRYVIVGAGAIGGTIAARLGQHASTTPLVAARGAHAEAIEQEGLRLRSPDDDTRVTVDVVTSAAEAELTLDDVLVFATKTHQLHEALLEWVDQPVHAGGEVVGTAGELLPALTALNGVEAERLALRLFRRVYGVCVWLPAVHLAPGEIVVRIAPVSGVFVVGRYGTPVDETDAAADANLLDSLRAEWERATFRVHLVEDVMRWKHQKLITNLGNAVQALAGPAADVPEVYRAAREEGLEVLAAAGIGIASDEEVEVWRGDLFRLREVPGLEGEVGGSTWQSLARGSGSVETDYLNGEIVRIARMEGVAAPVNEALQREARRAAAEGRPAGSLTPDRLRALVLPPA